MHVRRSGMFSMVPSLITSLSAVALDAHYVPMFTKRSDTGDFSRVKSALSSAGGRREADRKTTNKNEKKKSKKDREGKGKKKKMEIMRDKSRRPQSSRIRRQHRHCQI